MIGAVRGVSIRNLGPDEDETDADLAEVDAIFGSVPEGGRDRAPRLRWVARAGAGVEDVDMTALAARGITLTNSSGLHASSMGEFCMGALLFGFQHHAARLDAQRRHEWDARGGFAAPLRGLTLAVLGYGSIGREVARLGDALGMRVLAVKLRPEKRRDEGYRPEGVGDPDGSIPERIVGLDGLHDVLREADAVVVALPLTPRTRELIGAAELALMKPTAWIVNVGRGPMIDEAALVDALSGRRLGGAYLDVFDEEPLPADHPYWDTPNLYVSPHTAGVNSYERYWQEMGVLLEQNTRRFVAGEPLINAIDPARAY
jgi:phosphoglycerate dehydrogenase-like enzyme